MTLAEATTSRHEDKVTRLYEQGASKTRIAAYRLRWSAWAFAPLLRQVFFKPTSPCSLTLGIFIHSALCDIGVEMPEVVPVTSGQFGLALGNLV